MDESILFPYNLYNKLGYMKHVKRSDIEKPRILFLFIKTHEVYNTHWYTQSIFTITVSNAQS